MDEDERKAQNARLEEAIVRQKLDAVEREVDSEESRHEPP
jgi:hypothetical protein